MDPNRPGPRGGFFAVPCGPNHGSFALRRRILRCKIRGRVMTRPYGMNSIRGAWGQNNVGTPHPRCPRYRTKCPDTPPGVSLQEWDVGDAVPYGMNSIRGAEASDWSGGFTRLPSSTIHQSRVWLPALPGRWSFYKSFTPFDKKRI